MKTNHPDVFDIEFDRDELGLVFAQIYKGRACCLFGSVAFFGVIPVFVWLTEFIKYESPEMIPPWLAMVVFFAVSIGLLFGSIWIFGEVFLRIVGKRMGAKREKVYSARVEGPFLRIINGKRDRKIHFRQIGDYEAILGNKRKPDVGTINMMMPSSGNGIAYLALPAVTNVIAVRDALAEVDAARE